MYILKRRYLINHLHKTMVYFVDLFSIDKIVESFNYQSFNIQKYCVDHLSNEGDKKYFK